MKRASAQPARNPNRGASYGTLLRVAGPVLLGSLTQSVIYLTDSLLVGRLGEGPLAAMGMGGLLFYLMTTVGAGLGLSVQILVARRLAQGRVAAARRQFIAAGNLTLALGGALGGLLWLLAPAISTALVPAAAVAGQVAAYLRVVALAVPASYAWLWLVGLYTGLGQTRLLPWSALGITIANVVGSYAWILGGLGAPRLGVVGAAWATVLSESVGFAVLLAGLLWPAQPLLAGWLRNWGWHRRAARRVLRFAGPVVLKQVVEVSSWLLFFVLVARLGVRALAVSNIVRSLYTFASLPALALAAALQTIVSRYVGQGRQAAVLPTVRRAALLAVGLGLGPVLVLVAVPLQVAGGFSDEPALVAATRPLLQLLAALLLTFSASTMWSHAVVGVGGADRSLGMELGATSAYLLAAWGAVRLGWPLAAVWATELGYWALLGGLSWRYLRRGQWQILQ
ncbi:MATE family efflux transporter [Hymenobacter humi]